MGVTAGYFVFLFYLHFHVYTNLKITYLKFLRDEFEKGNEGWGDIKLNFKITAQIQTFSAAAKILY